VPRLLHLLALLLVFMMSGAPTWVSALAEGGCADERGDECGCEGDGNCQDEGGHQGGDKCTNDPSGCPEEGCGDCSVLCSSCPRTHLVMPSLVVRIAPVELATWWLAGEVGQRLPISPPARDVFHPPRFAS
jgi:hypothetical protein